MDEYPSTIINFLIQRFEIAETSIEITGYDDWPRWLHLYVMFSRATCMDDMLLLRPPPRELLERGPPASVCEALKGLEQNIAESTEAAAALCAEMGLPVPA